MDNNLIAPNIRRIRSYKGLTQKIVAKQAGISLPAYRKIETGKSVPKVDTLMGIAKALSVQIQELVAPMRTLSHVRFRALKKMNARDQILVDAAAWLESYNFIEELMKDKQSQKFEKLLNKIQADKKVLDDPIEVARLARKGLNIGPNEVIRDICGLLESIGIKVLPYVFTHDSFFGLSIGIEDGGPAIVVNTNNRMPVERWIFSAAHEFGHLLLHVNSFDINEKEESELEEREANIFASHFLMPNEVFEREWQDAYGLGLVRRVLKVKRIFKVSYKTVLYRLVENGDADGSLWQKYNWQYKKKTGRSLGGKVEPLPIAQNNFAESRSADETANLSSEDFIPDRLYGLVRKAIDQEEISLARAAEILRIDLNEMRELVNSWIVEK